MQPDFKTTALVISHPYGARKPHVLACTLRFLRSGWMRTNFARYVFKSGCEELDFNVATSATDGDAMEKRFPGPSKTGSFRGASMDGFTAILGNLLSMKSPIDVALNKFD